MATPTLDKLKNYVKLREKIEKFAELKRRSVEELAKLYSEEELQSLEEQLRSLAEEVRATDLLPVHRQELLGDCTAMLEAVGELKVIKELAKKYLMDLKVYHDELLKRIDEKLGLLETRRSNEVLSRDEVEECLHWCDVVDSYLSLIEFHCARLHGVCDHINIVESRRTLNIFKESLERYLRSKEKEEVLTVARLISILNQFRGYVSGIITHPASLESQRTPPPPYHQPPQRPVVGVEVEVGGDSVIVEPPFVIGRYDPSTEGGSYPADSLAVKKEGEGVIYTFKSTKCRWGCRPPDTDCTSRRHVRVFAQGENIVVEQLSSEAKTWVGEKVGETALSRLELRPGQQVKLWLSGVYNASGQRTPVILRHVMTSRPTVLRK